MLGLQYRRGGVGQNLATEDNVGVVTIFRKIMADATDRRNEQHRRRQAAGDDTGVVEGRFPRRALRAVMEWHELHRDELSADWQRAERHEPLQRIPPLE